MLWLIRPDYRAHATFVEPARPTAELWRLGAGLLLVITIFVFLSEAVLNVVLGDRSTEEQADFLATLLDGQTPAAVIFVLLQIALLIPAAALVTLALHRRFPLTLLGPLQLATKQFGAVFIVQIALAGLVLLLPPYSYDGAYPTWNLDAARWMMLLPVALVAVGLQCAGEEIAFRGYLQQQLAARIKSPVIWMGLPSALFAFGHYMPETAGENALSIACLAFLFGMLMADLTARAGTLGPAIAVHMANNIVAILLIAPADDLSGLALFTLPFGLADTEIVQSWLLVDLASIVICWLAARLVLRR